MTNLAAWLAEHMNRFRLTLVALIAAVVVVAAILLATDRRQRAPQRTATSYADLVAANYRVLTAAQTRRLLRFADAFSSCMSKRGIEIGKPKPLNTRIEMAPPPGVDRQRVARLALACGDSLGGPPAGASLQAVQQRGRNIVLYLPKRCLLDRKAVARAT